MDEASIKQQVKEFNQRARAKDEDFCDVEVKRVNEASGTLKLEYDDEGEKANSRGETPVIFSLFSSPLFFLSCRDSRRRRPSAPSSW
jgi:hypothetical protein